MKRPNHKEFGDENSDEDLISTLPRRKRSKFERPVDNNSSDYDSESGYNDRRRSNSSRRAARNALISQSGEISDDAEDEELEMNDGIPFETGQILKVSVAHFMCHERYTIDFGRNVNFVTGQNGSGKSAIVAAIQLCLGVNARATGRGNSLSGLIREGWGGPATVAVTLLNRGLDAYKPDTYGKRITVERKILPNSGGGGYRLLSANGEVISQEKRELENILRTFNIFGDNPCCILTQEESKRFIQGQEKEKYAFFLKATGLERTKQELESAIEMQTMTAKDLKESERKLKNKKEHMDKLKGELEALLALDKYQDDIRRALAKLLWLDVYEADEFVKELEAERVAAEADMRKAQEVLKHAEDQQNSIGSFDEIEAQLQTTQGELGRVSTDAESLKGEVNSMNQQISKVQREIRAMVNNKAEHTSRLDSVKREIQELRKKALESAADDERKYLEQVEVYRNKLSELEANEAQLRQSRHTASQTLNEQQRAAQQLSSQENALSNDLQRLERDFRDISTSGDSRVAAFGPKIPKILSDMKTRRFRGPVVGPLGAYVKIRKEHEGWGQALERVLGKVVSSFLVTNSEDQQTLMSILKGNGANFMHSVVVQMNGESQSRYDVGSINGALSVVDCLVIENDMVFNCIVDQCKIDSTIVVENAEECRQFVQRVNGKDCFQPSNIQRAVCKDGLALSYRNGNRAAERPQFPYRRLLAADMAEVLQGLRDEMQIKRTQLEDLRLQSESARARAKEMHEDVGRIEIQLRNLTAEAKRLQRMKGDLESKLSEVQAAANVDTSALEKEEEELKLAIESVAKQEEEKRAALAALNLEIRDLKENSKEAEARREAILAQLREKESMLEKFISNRDKKRAAVARAETEVEKKRRIVDTAEKHKDTKIAEKNKKEEAARAKTPDLIENWDGEPIPCGQRDTRANLQNQVKSLQAKLEVGRRQRGLDHLTLPEASENYRLAKDDYKSSKDQFLKLSEMMGQLNGDITWRKKRWTQQLKHSERIVASNFDRYMQRKGFAGTVRFNHEEGTLHLTCQIDNQDDKSRTDDVRQLSGGERSYTTLCLLMALGHVIECPFRLMDEYDVFLDDVSRKMTLDELQRYASNPMQRGRQFIIVTPHNLADVRTSNEVRIRRLAPPRRNSAHGPRQQILPFNEDA